MSSWLLDGGRWYLVWTGWACIVGVFVIVVELGIGGSGYIWKAGGWPVQGSLVYFNEYSHLNLNLPTVVWRSVAAKLHLSVNSLSATHSPHCDFPAKLQHLLDSFCGLLWFLVWTGNGTSLRQPCARRTQCAMSVVNLFGSSVTVWRLRNYSSI